MHFAVLDGGPRFKDVQGFFLCVSLSGSLMKSMLYYSCDLVLLQNSQNCGVIPN